MATILQLSQGYPGHPGMSTFLHPTTESHSFKSIDILGHPGIAKDILGNPGMAAILQLSQLGILGYLPSYTLPLSPIPSSL